MTSRKINPLSESLIHKLNSYALVATAAGVGALPFVQPAEAKVVYTPAHVKMDKVRAFYPIDFNQDGKFDVGVWFTSGHTSSGGATGLLAYPNSNYGNAVAVIPKSPGLALAIRAGATIGAFRKSSPKGQQPEIAGMACQKSTCQWVGMWVSGGKGLKDRYLGVKFAIDGKFHYGWARITVVVPSDRVFYGVLTGYAYETIPNKKIIAGKTKGPETQAATLGGLAVGRK